MNEIATLMYAKKQAHENTRVRVGTAIAVRDNQGFVLLEKRSDCSMWGFPGGAIEPGESVIEAAKREVKEETGLIIEITRFIGIYSDPENRIVTYLDNGDVVHLVDIFLEGTILSGDLSCSQESEELQFFDPHNLPTDIVPPAKAPLEDLVAGLSGIIR